MTPDRDDELAALARELPWQAPEPERRQAVRDAIVLEAQVLGVEPAPPSRRRPVLLAAAAVLAVAAGLAIYLSLPASQPPVATVHRASVQASSAADFVHSARRADGINDEVVRLRGGRVSVAVDHLAPDQRFRVVAGDGEVEVRGTAFDVIVVDDRLEGVVVHHGLVLVRVRGEQVAEVGGGMRWSRESGVERIALSPPPSPPSDPVSDPVPVPVPVPDRIPPPSPSPSPTPSPPAVSASASAPAPAPDPDPAPAPAPAPVPTSDPEASATEHSFRLGREALRDGDFGTAADLFAAAIAADPSAPLAEDARYWRGIALARAGRDRAARSALEDFLALHPASLHAGRASLVLGGILARAGDLDAARIRYQAATDDPDTEVVAAARKALAALDR